MKGRLTGLIANVKRGGSATNFEHLEAVSAVLVASAANVNLRWTPVADLNRNPSAALPNDVRWEVRFVDHCSDFGLTGVHRKED